MLHSDLLLIMREYFRDAARFSLIHFISVCSLMNRKAGLRSSTIESNTSSQKGTAATGALRSAHNSLRLQHVDVGVTVRTVISIRFWILVDPLIWQYRTCARLPASQMLAEAFLDFLIRDEVAIYDEAKVFLRETLILSAKNLKDQPILRLCSLQMLVLIPVDKTDYRIAECSDEARDYPQDERISQPIND